MNEQIKKLAKQAGFGLRRDGEIYTSRLEHLPITEDLTKFAELIVRECAEVCYDHSNAAGGVDTHFGYGYKDCGDDIKRNFGVKE